MARQTPLSSLTRLSEINLTPLMDLTFILLITFIITFPLIEQGIPVDLPQAGADALPPERAQSVTVNREGVVFLDEIEVTVEELVAQMTAVNRADPNVAVMVRADQSVQYAAVVKVLAGLRRAGITRMALVTREDELARP